MEKVRKKLIREKAVIAVYQYLLTNSTEEEITNYLNEFSKEISINQAVELAKKYCDEDAYKFINGVLGAIG